MIHDAADALQCEQPHFRRAVVKVHELLHVLLGMTPLMLSKVLMLMIVDCAKSYRPFELFTNENYKL